MRTYIILKDNRQVIGIDHYGGKSIRAIAKLGRNENVSLDTLEKICVSLSCRIEDVVTFVDISTQNTDNNGK